MPYPLSLTTPAPVYTPDQPSTADAPRLAAHQQTEALAAMHHARRRYPGPAGGILAAEIGAFKDLGRVAQPTCAVARLIHELMTS